MTDDIELAPACGWCGTPLPVEPAPDAPVACPGCGREVAAPIDERVTIERMAELLELPGADKVAVIVARLPGSPRLVATVAVMSGDERPQPLRVMAFVFDWVRR